MSSNNGIDNLANVEHVECIMFIKVLFTNDDANDFIRSQVDVANTNTTMLVNTNNVHYI